MNMPLIEYMADNNPFIDLMTSKLEKKIQVLTKKQTQKVNLLKKMTIECWLLNKSFAVYILSCLSVTDSNVH